jgi:RimJ/RimL family protein N-acetyltransferase
MNDIYLCAFEKSYLPSLHQWMNDSESIAMIGRLFYTFEETEIFVEKKRNSGDYLLGIKNSLDQLLGWVHLSKIEPEHGRAEIGILVAPEYRGHGIGRIGMELMLEVAFDQLRLHRIYLTTRAINQRGISLYEKIGFSIEGHLREHTFIQGKFYDTIIMGILSQEWYLKRSLL